jgi:photosynthetic reaction center cytochrome c subunit
MSNVRTSAGVLAAAACALLAGCERPPVDVVQTGFRGTGMEQVYNPRRVVDQTYANVLPARIDPASPDGPKAKEAYQNVRLLGDLSVGEFTRLMVAMNDWVAPKEGPDAGCLYCHTTNFAEDTKYTKVVARRMLEMTWKVNRDWKSHVADTGVTCWTCHRGQPVPANVWFAPEPQRHAARLLGDKALQNSPAVAAVLTSLPYDPFGPYLSDAQPIRVQGPTALPTGNRTSIKQTEFTYALMTHMSDSLGVNCTYCHNSRSWSDWSQSPPQRATAWHGIRMARDLNVSFMQPLTGAFPANRLGPTGDVPKVNCATCHQGAYKPMYGQSMIADHPELSGVKIRATPAAAPAAAPAGPSPVTILFGVGSSALSPEGAQLVDRLAAALRSNPGASVAISGFHSAAGNLAANQELAKRRAFAVRDALRAAGVAEDRLQLDKPMQTEGNLSGEDPRSRRVDVAVR